MVDRPFDHQRIGYLVTKKSPPITKPTAGVGKAADEIIERSVSARLQLMPQRRLVLIEAVIHRDAHLLPARLTLSAMRTEAVRESAMGFSERTCISWAKATSTTSL